MSGKNINIHVFYTRGNNHQKNYDPGFKQDINWDVPLLEGYDFTWLNNVSKDAGTHYFKGIKKSGAHFIHKKNTNLMPY